MKHLLQKTRSLSIISALIALLLLPGTGWARNVVNYNDTGEIRGMLASFITINGYLEPFNTTPGVPSVPQSYEVRGDNLDPDNGDIHIQAPTGFQISRWIDGPYETDIDLTANNGSVSPTTIWVRLYSESANEYSGYIQHTSFEISPVELWVEGTVVQGPDNDFCENAITLNIGEPAISGTMVNATYTSPFWVKDVWYKFTPSSSGTHTVIVDGFSGDIDVEIYSYSCPYSTEYLYQAWTTNNPEVISESFIAGIDYFIRVFAADESASTSTFNIGITVPVISVVPAILTGFSYVQGSGPSTPQSYTLSGSNLVPEGGYVRVTSPENYEISFSDESSSYCIGADLYYEADGTFPATIIFVRLKAGLNAGDYNDENITHEGGGAAPVNVNCSGNVAAPPPIGWCNLQWPPSGTITIGTGIDVYGQVWIDGITQEAGATSGLQAWVGYSTGNTNPDTWTNWIPADFNVQAGNNDEFVADLGAAISVAGTYYYAYRFQYYTAPYVYGGTGGFWNGTGSNSGVLIVNPLPQLDWCNLQWPLTANIVQSDALTVYANVWEPGVTDVNPGQGAGISAWIGYSNTNTDPATWTNWVSATYFTDAGNDDEYVASIGASLPAGTYYYASRFQLGTAPYVYGGSSAFWNGTNSVSGVLTVNTFPQIDWANVTWPHNGSIDMGENFIVYAEVYEQGVTETPGEGDNIQHWIGYSASNTNPDSWTNWVPAGYLGDDGGVNDEYAANIGAAITTPGTYYYASRFQLGDAPFVYGGLGSAVGGFWDGITNVSGVLTVMNLPQIDWCNLQWPLTAAINQGNSITVYARVYEPGVTDVNPGQGAGISAWIGYSSSNTDPATWSNWVLATYNTDVGNDDEYMANIGASLAPGTYYYASRFQLGTAPYVYGGSSAFWNGTNSVSGTLFVYGTKTNITTGDWNDADIWDPIGVPTAFDNVDITDAVEIDGTANCHNLIAITAQGMILVVSGGSVIPTGSVSCPVVLDRHILAANWSLATNGWHLVSSPVPVQDINPVQGWITVPATSYDFYSYNESLVTNYWLNQKIPANNITSFEVGKGYLVAYQNEGDKLFFGNTLNVNNLTNIPLSYTSGSPNAGWNLIGNPYASGLTWDTWAYGNGTVISGTAKVLLSTSGAYEDITQGEVIPAMNGFFVHTNNNTATLTIPASARTHGGVWYKNTGSVSKLTLTAIDLDGETVQTSHVRIHPEATTGYDRLYDSEFRPFNAPQFYSVSADMKLSTNAIPEVTEATVIDFGFIKNNGNNFRIEATGLESISATPYLTDRKTGIVTNLRQTPVYAFTASPGDEVNRFALHFGALGIDHPGIEQANIYAYGGIIYLTDMAGSSVITVTNLLGQVVQQARTTGSGTTTLNAQALPKGVYVVSVVSNGQTLSRKVVL